MDIMPIFNWFYLQNNRNYNTIDFKISTCFPFGGWMSQEYSTFGRHVVLDAWGVEEKTLNNVHWLEDQLQRAAKACGATILSVQSRAFEPQGATVMVMLSESHLTIHTYPEAGFAGLDCYTCGETVDPAKAIRYMLQVLEPKEHSGIRIRRGRKLHGSKLIRLIRLIRSVRIFRVK
jgi:S-adenosylmethionine decarboxylase